MSEVLGIELPTYWSTSRLKHVTSRLNRGSAPTYADAGAVRVISQAANQAMGLDWERTRFHEFAGDPSKLKGNLRAADLLINSTGTGTLGRVGYFEPDPEGYPCMADSHVTIARANGDQLYSRFGYYWLNSRPFQDYIYAALVVGATNQIELNRDRLCDAPVPLPPIHEQLRIAEFLDNVIARIDSLDALRSAQLELMSEHEESFLDELFAACNSGTDTRVKYLLSSRPRYGVLVPEFVDEGVKFIRVNDLIDLNDKEENLRMIPADLSFQHARTIVQAGDLLMSVVGTLGRAAIAPHHLAGANIARAVCSVRVKADIEVELLKAWLSTASFRIQALVATSNDTAQPTLGMEDFGNFRLRWPVNRPERVRMVREIASAEVSRTALRLKLQRQKELFAERRQALITAAVTGQFDVFTASGRGVTE
jgi:type I restriction enzyme S subunit